jgi:hypothetical protein
MSTELTTAPEKADIPKLFETEDGIEGLVKRIEDEVRALHIDTTTELGRKEARSVAAKVSRSKTLIDDVGKELNEERNRLNKIVNAKRAEARDRLDALRDEVKAPVEAWEAKEAERVRRHEVAMDIFDPDQVSALNAVDEIKAAIAKVEATEVNPEWEEYEARAREAKASVLLKLSADLGVAVAREEQARELEALRAREAERQREDEERAAKERAAEEERQREEERRRFEEKAKQDAAERAAREYKEAAERHERELQAAKEREERAAQAERDRIAAEQAKAEAEAASRAKDKAVRENAIQVISTALSGVQPRTFKAMAEAIINGDIPHVKAVL